MTDVLLPCPFCGSDVSIEEDLGSILCSGCGFGYDMNGPTNEAVAAWNTRALSDEEAVVRNLANLDPVVGPFRFQEPRKNPLDFDEKQVRTSRRICGLCRRRSADNGENVTHTPECPWLHAKAFIRRIAGEEA